jgi:hypothetical protein
MVIPTPLPGLAAVTLYRDTWFDKITKNHLEMLGKEDAVRQVVSSPTAVRVALTIKTQTFSTCWLASRARPRVKISQAGLSADTPSTTLVHAASPSSVTIATAGIESRASLRKS